MNKVLTNDSGPFNKIQVSFALAPPEFPFTIYTVRLYKVNGTSSVSAVNVTKDVSGFFLSSNILIKEKKAF